MAPDDYTSFDATNYFQPDTCTNLFSIPIIDDDVAEGDETFTVTFSNPNFLWFGPTQFLVTIVDNDNHPPEFNSPEPPPEPNADKWSVTLLGYEKQGDGVLMTPATDPENDPLTYSITSGNSDGVFAIDNAAGAGRITLAKDAKAASKPQYVLGIEVADNSGNPNNKDTATVTVNMGWGSDVLDLDISGLDEQEEDDPGGVVVKNADNNNAPRQEITLKSNSLGSVVLTITSSAGHVDVFDAETGGNPITFDGTDNVFAPGTLPRSLYVEGTLQSNSMHDITLTLAPEEGGAASDTVNFTVLWVDPIGVNFSRAQHVSPDNQARPRYMGLTEDGQDFLGLQLFVTGTSPVPGAPDHWGWGTEAKGIVHPPNFQVLLSDAFLDRDAEFKVWDGNGTLVDEKVFGRDKSDEQNRDDSAYDSNPIGSIYDLDWPGLKYAQYGNNGIAKAGTILRYRANFEIYAAWGSDNVRASFYRDYFVRFSINQMDAPEGDRWELLNQTDTGYVQGDNDAGYGYTPLTADLQ